MNRREPKPLPSEVLRELEAGSEEDAIRAARVWTLLGGMDETTLDIPDTEDALSEVFSRIDAPPARAPLAQDRKPVRRAQRQRRRVFGTAAFGTASVLVAALVFFIYISIPVAHQALPGEQMSVSLPDGSTVQLNSGARIEFARAMGLRFNPLSPTRSVALDGEAYFNVESSDRPFVVETFNAEVTVLGTAFNVRAYAGEAEQETRVVLSHGRVRVTVLENQAQEVLLTEPGHSAVIQNSALVDTDAVVAENALAWEVAWRENGFVATGLSMSSLLNELERRYALDIDVANGFAIEPTDLIYPEQAPGIETVLTDFCLAQQCAFQSTSTGYRLIPAE